MRPRTAFAILLAIGAVMHLVLSFLPPVSFGYLTLYLCWLVPSAAFAWLFWARSSATPSLSARGRRMRQPASSGLWMEGLGVFLVIATVGLVIHLLGPFKAYRPSIGAAQWTQGGAMGLMFALSAAGCWALLRGAPGDTTAPIPDGSRVVRAGGWVRRLAGVLLAGWGAWLLVVGIRAWGTSAGIDRHRPHDESCVRGRRPAGDRRRPCAGTAPGPQWCLTIFPSRRRSSAVRLRSAGGSALCSISTVDLGHRP